MLSHHLREQGFLSIETDGQTVWMGKDVEGGIQVEQALKKVKDLYQLKYKIEFFDTDGNLLN